MPQRPVERFNLIGVDGGATKVTAWQVIAAESDRGVQFRLGSAMGTRTYDRLAEFEPVPIGRQLEQMPLRVADLSPLERAQAQVVVRGATDAIVEAAGAITDPSHPLLIGIGMPGLKTADGRGIVAMNNGPRMPHYLDDLERALRNAGLRLAAPIDRLGSDADYCGLGEEFGEGGSFRSVDNAYYVGGGTGLADALKLAGRLMPLDDARDWLLKSWQLASPGGETYEKIIAPGAINRRYEHLGGRGGGFPEALALAGDPMAARVLVDAATALAELVVHRLTVLADRRPGYPNPGTILSRVVIGQRLGAIFGDPGYHHLLRYPFFAALDELLAGAERENSELRIYRQRGLVNLVVTSSLQEAPALGAAIDAFHRFRGGE